MAGGWLAAGALVVTLAATGWMSFRAARSDPDGHRRRLAMAGLLVSMGIAQSIPGIYEPVDTALGGFGFFYLAAHVGLAVAAGLIASALAWTFSFPSATTFITGTAGRFLLVCCVTGMIVSWGVVLREGGIDRGSGSVAWGALEATSYAFPTWVSCVLLAPSVVSAALPGRPRLFRASSALMAAAFICASVAGVLVILRVSTFVRVDVLLYPAVGMFSASLIVRWISSAVRGARRQRDLSIAA